MILAAAIIFARAARSLSGNWLRSAFRSTGASRVFSRAKAAASGSSAAAARERSTVAAIK
jgi:hypothetical protein